MPSVALLVCEELHRRTKRYRVDLARDIAQQSNANSALHLPVAFQCFLNRRRRSCQLEEFDIHAGMPGRPPVHIDAMPSLVQGDVVAHGLVIVDIPGHLFRGPLSLKTFEHRITHALLGYCDRCAFSLLEKLCCFMTGSVGSKQTHSMCHASSQSPR